MMALRKAPARRYASAEQLAEDLRRTSDGLPVRARKDTVRYRVRKFVGRNRYGVGTALLVLTLVVGFGINRAQLARDLALERDRARQEADVARRAATFLQDVFRSADPTEASGNAVTAREILDRAAENLAARPDERPEVRAELMDTMGTVYEHLGLYASAEPLLQEALAMRRRSLGEQDLDTARSLLHLGNLRAAQSRNAESEDLLRRALATRETRLGPNHPDVAEALSSLGLVLRRQGKSVEAERDLRRAVAIDESTLGDAAPVALVLDRLALVLDDEGRLTEAEKVARRAVDIARRRLGPHHVDTARAVGRLGIVLSEKGDYAAAEPLIKEALDTRRLKFGPDHPTVALWREQWANLLRDRGDLAEAERVYREALAGAGTLGDEHYEVASIRANLAELLIEQGRLEEAGGLFARSFEVRDRLQHDGLFALASREGVARVAAARGDVAGAEATLRQVLEARRRSGLPPGLPLAGTLLALGEVLTARNQPAAAEPFLRQALDLRRGELLSRHKDVAVARGALGASLMAQGRYAEAEPLLVESLAGLHRRPAASAAAARLVRLYEAWGRPEKADPYRDVAART
jgi:serine/threonine-protein kinase